jgi:hypothetical protein
MQVKSLESGRVEKLEIIDSYFVNYAQDSIGNSGGLDSDIVLCEDTGDYVTKDDETLDFWLSFCEREQASGEGLDIARKIGLANNDSGIFHTISGDIESDQAYFLNAIKDVLEDSELLQKLDVDEGEAKEAHEEICELLNRECFK